MTPLTTSDLEALKAAARWIELDLEGIEKVSAEAAEPELSEGNRIIAGLQSIIDTFSPEREGEPCNCGAETVCSTAVDGSGVGEAEQINPDKADNPLDSGRLDSQNAPGEDAEMQICEQRESR